jgi:hypothetical protein
MIMDLGSVAVEKAASPARWNPTSAKTGQIWGTRHLLLVERRKKFRLGATSASHETSSLFLSSNVQSLHDVRIIRVKLERFL